MDVVQLHPGICSCDIDRMLLFVPCWRRIYISVWQIVLMLCVSKMLGLRFLGGLPADGYFGLNSSLQLALHYCNCRWAQAH